MKLTNLFRRSAWKSTYRNKLFPTYVRFVLKRKGVEFSKNVKFIGMPIVYRIKGKIILGNNVQIRSRDWGYHTAMYSPTRLMTDSSEEAILAIGNGTRINGASIHATNKIIIGENCLIAANVTIMDSDGHGVNLDERDKHNTKTLPIIIGNNVWIGINSVILKGISIGNNSVIAAGSVVTKTVPPNTLVGGNPARVIKMIKQPMFEN